MSDAEAVRYDRQIRLWGKSTQQQLMHTNVAFYGIAGAAAEAAKNLVLAGVRAVAVVDAAAVSEKDADENYLMQGERGDSRAARAMTSLHRLNPYVRICGSAAELESANATVSVVCIHSIDDGTTYVQQQESERETSAAARLPPPSDILVLLASQNQTVMAFVLYRRLASTYTVAEQWRRLVANPALLAEKPRAYQQLVLALHLRNGSIGGTDASPSRRSFAEAAVSAYELMDRLHLQQLTVPDVEDAVRCSLTSDNVAASDSVSATIAGACIAQHLIRQIGTLQEALDAQSHRWLACVTANEVECLVGM